ncbi:MAG: histidine kinase [Agriterribacter sp.]
MLRNKWIPVFVIYLFCSSAQSQQFLWQKDIIHLSTDKEKYITKIIGAKDGLPSSEILVLFQDSKGFVWIGTSTGVSKYDGYSFENHITAGNKQLGKINNIVEDILHNIIWIMSDAGLSYYQNGYLHPIVFEEDNITVYDMGIDKRHIYWIATAKGPVYYTKEEMPGIIQTKKGNIGAHLIPGWRSSLKEDSLVRLIKPGNNGKVWFSSKSIMYCYDGRHTRQVWRSPSFNDQINTILPQNDKVFFVSTINGIFECSETNKVAAVPFQRTLSANIYNSGGTLYYMCLDGIFRFNPENYSFTFLCKIPEAVTTWLSCTMVDREKNIWIGMHDALFLQRKKLFYEYKSDNNTIELFCGYVKKDGTLLLGGNRGKVFIKKDTTLVNYLGKQKSVCSRSTLAAIYEDKRGWLWYGTAYQGIAIRQNNHLKILDKTNGLGCDQNYFFLETTNGDIWTGGDGFLTRLRKQQGNDSIACSSYVSLINGDNWFVFLNAIEGPNETIWVAGSRGLFKFSDEKLSQYTLSDSTAINISDIKKTPGNEVWFTTKGNGIWQCYFDEKGSLQLKKKYNTEDGLNTNSYLNILIDEQNNIWAVSYSGISKIAFHNNKFFISNYTANDGFPDKNYQSARLMQDSNKTIWIITSDGLSHFNPQDPAKSGKRPLIVLNTVKAGDNIYYNNSNASQTSPLMLNYNENELSFTFSGIYFSNPSEVKYFYRLSSSDSSWKDNGNNRTINFEGLRPGNYILQTKAVAGNNESHTNASYQFIIQKPFWQTWWFYTICAVVTGAGIYVWIKQKEKSIKKAAAEKAAIQKHIAELETKALKSQMNPHFVFNSLNSIAHLVASNQNEKGIEYLTKFSKLLRIILEESENNFVVLKDEIKMLDLYLQIEAMRFGDSFSYSIKADNNIEEDETSVPALLLHPLVENAVWHGLLHKQGQRRLMIHFKKITEDLLQCTIKDNGIGIEAAKAMKEKRLNGIAQQSKGTQLVKDRLKMLEQQFDKPAYFVMEDIHAGNYSISGTKVTIQFPVLYES